MSISEFLTCSKYLVSASSFSRSLELTAHTVSFASLKLWAGIAPQIMSQKKQQD